MLWISDTLLRLVQAMVLSSCWTNTVAERDGQHGDGVGEVRVNAIGNSGSDVRRWPPNPLPKEEYLTRLNSKLPSSPTLREPWEEKLPTGTPPWPHPQARQGVKYCNIDGKIEGKASYVKAMWQLKDCLMELKHYRKYTRFWGKKSNADNAAYWDQYKNIVSLLNEVEMQFPFEEAFDQDQRRVVTNLQGFLRKVAGELDHIREAPDTANMARLAKEGDSGVSLQDFWTAPLESHYEVSTADGRNKVPAGWWISQNGKLKNTSTFDSSFRQHGVGGADEDGAGWSVTDESQAWVPPEVDYRDQELEVQTGGRSEQTHLSSLLDVHTDVKLRPERIRSQRHSVSRGHIPT